MPDAKSIIASMEAALGEMSPEDKKFFEGFAQGVAVTAELLRPSPTPPSEVA